LITDLVGEYLKREGYESEAVNDPLAVMQALIRGHYRIVLLDVHMPHKSGLQLLQEIKQFDAGIQVILLTSLVNETTVIEANRLGAEACLFKPMADPADFLNAVEDASRRNDRWWQTLRDLTMRRKEQTAGSTV
ncbi:MAG: response regulator, partial [Planctomycetota bacterium]